MDQDNHAYTYDPIGNRIASDEPLFGPHDGLTPTLDRNYIYDGWNVLLEVDLVQAIPEIARGFVWGLDLSQFLQGAGGVGGLLSVITLDTSSSSYMSYIPSYDANGNITEYTDTAGAIVAHYQYDPFGNITTQTGTLAEKFPHRFSTKYTDDESGLVYYGYRFYKPELGRWINRDPIGERGGKNLYLAFRGNSVGLIDSDGLIALPAPILWCIYNPKACADWALLIQGLLELLPAPQPIQEGGEIPGNTYPPPKNIEGTCPPSGSHRVVYQKMAGGEQCKSDRVWHEDYDHWSKPEWWYKVRETYRTVYNSYSCRKQYRVITYECVCKRGSGYSWEWVDSTTEWIRTRDFTSWKSRGWRYYYLDLGIPPVMWE